MPETGSTQSGPDLGQRNECEAARGQARVREDRVGTGAPPAADVEDVHVDLPRSVHERRGAPHPPLDLPHRAEESSRRAGPRDLDHGVPEVGLVAKADRLRPVERGDLPDACKGCDLAKRRLEMGTPISDVGAESEVRERGDSRVSS